MPPNHARTATLVPLLLLVLLTTGCGSMVNYVDTSPVFRGGEAAPRPASDQIRVVTFNIRFGIRYRRALIAIQSSPELRSADVFLLQEVHEEAVAYLAAGLGCEYVYYPISIHPKHDRNFGNAVLTRGTIDGTSRILASRDNWLNGQRRGATVARATVRGREWTVVSAHTGTAVMSLARRMDQVRDILGALAAVEGPVIVGGDFNVVSDAETRTLTRAFEKGGLRRLSVDAERTAALALGLRGTLDLIYGRGVVPLASGVARHGDASDHRPVWALVRTQGGG